MNIRNTSTYEIVKAAWNALPRSGSGGRVYVCVNTKTGEVYPVFESQSTIVSRDQHEEEIFTLRAGSQSEIISDWVTDEDIFYDEDVLKGRTRYDLPEKLLRSCTLELLHERNRLEIQDKIEKIIEKHTHLA